MPPACYHPLIDFTRNEIGISCYISQYSNLFLSHLISLLTNSECMRKSLHCAVSTALRALPSVHAVPALPSVVGPAIPLAPSSILAARSLFPTDASCSGVTTASRRHYDSNRNRTRETFGNNNDEDLFGSSSRSSTTTNKHNNSTISSNRNREAFGNNDDDDLFGSSDPATTTAAAAEYAASLSRSNNNTSDDRNSHYIGDDYDDELDHE